MYKQRVEHASRLLRNISSRGRNPNVTSWDYLKLDKLGKRNRIVKRGEGKKKKKLVLKEVNRKNC